MRATVVCAGVLLMVCGAAQAALTLAPEGLGTSVMIPSVGHEVTYTARLGGGEGGLRGEYAARLLVDGEEVARAEVTVALAAGETRDAKLDWTPREDGWHEVRVSVEGGGERAEAALRVAVTARPLYFVWFGAPQDFRWCNVPTTVADRDRDWWLWRGALPCGWEPGVCNADWTEEQFYEAYSQRPWIGIDELGGFDDLAGRVLRAVRRHKALHPEGRRVIWFVGADAYWRDWADCVDLFVPEVYLNYRGNHLGAIDEYLARSAQAGVMDRVIPGLGINIITDANKQPTVTPTREDILRQVRHLKRVAPDLSGVGFFYSDGGAPGVAQYSDELCGEYYVQPVVTLAPGALTGRLTEGGELELTARVGNRGGMTARGVRVELGRGYGQVFTVEQTLEVAPVAVGAEQTVTARLRAEPGVGCYGARLVAPGGVTVLDGAQWLQAAGEGTPAGVVLGRLPGEVTMAGMPVLAQAPDGVEVRSARRLDQAGLGTPDSRAAALEGMPGDEGKLVTWVPMGPEEGQPLAYALSAAKLDGPAGLEWTKAGSVVTVKAPRYEATLDLARDAITSLKARADGPELIASPWEFNCTGHAGFGPARVEETEAGLQVTVPFESEQASGFSRYFLYAEAAALRVERYWAPKGEVNVTASSEGCGMVQRGGVFALQGGVGGVIQRGELHDSQEYRDLLFGFMGGAPGPRNARLAGWFDCSFSAEGGGGLGVVIERRWEAAHSDVGYDVTRYYDGGDGIGVLNLWGKGMTVSEPQCQVLWLAPHEEVALERAEVVGPAQRLWGSVRAGDTVAPVPRASR